MSLKMWKNEEIQKLLSSQEKIFSKLQPTFEIMQNYEKLFNLVALSSLKMPKAVTALNNVAKFNTLPKGLVNIDKYSSSFFSNSELARLGENYINISKNIGAVFASFDNVAAFNNVAALRSVALKMVATNSSILDSVAKINLGAYNLIKTIPKDFTVSAIDSYIEELDPEKEAEEIKEYEEIKEKIKDNQIKEEALSDRQQAFLDNLLSNIIGGLILILVGKILFTDSPQINTTYNYNFNIIQEINQHYFNETGLSAEELNIAFQARYVLNDKTPVYRSHKSIKHIIARLNAGQIVTVAVKHKKWVLITFADKNGNINSGWVQNYKIKKFKRTEELKKR